MKEVKGYGETADKKAHNSVGTEKQRTLPKARWKMGARSHRTNLQASQSYNPVYALMMQ